MFFCFGSYYGQIPGKEVSILQEEKIAAALADRDEAMMCRVINKYSRLLWPIVSSVLQGVGNEQDVEECVADAFICLWEHPEKFDPKRGRLKTLLCVLARSRAIDRYREIMRKNTVPLEDAVLSSGAGLQELLLQEKTRRELLAAVKALEEPNREILIRRYYQDQKPRQIALALGMTVKQVDNSLYRSKRQLRELLTERGGVK